MPTKETILSFANNLCFDRFRPGIDNITAKSNFVYFSTNIDEIMCALENGTYLPKPALSFAILKKSGKARELSRFCAQDVVIQRALAFQVSEELTDQFSIYSYAYIPERGVKAAVEQFLTYSKKYKYAAKIDPVSCFDNIDRSILAQKVKTMLGESAATDLILKFAEVKIADEKGVHARKRGILQGSPLSPLLCNLYFDSLDKHLEQHNIPFCRYADDVVVFADSMDQAGMAADVVVSYLTKQLLLEINPNKFIIAPIEDMEYLGHTFVRDGHGLYYPVENASKNQPEHTNYWLRVGSSRNHKAINILSDGILTRKDMILAFEGDSNSFDIPLEAIEQINVYASVVFAPGVIETAFRYGVTIGVFDRYGHLLGRFSPADRFHNVNVALNQLEIYHDKNNLRAAYARDFLLSQLHNIRLNLRYQRKQYHSTRCSSAIDEMKETENQIRVCSKPEELLLLEAKMKKIYYGCFEEFIKNENFSFSGRTRRPPKDEINALLSFANVFLYNYIACEINKTPLDIRIAFLHSTTSRSESLNLDLADVFKPLIVDRTVFSIINKRMITRDHFSVEKNGGVYLTAAGKRILISALYDKLEQVVPIQNDHMAYYQILHKEIQSLCADIKAQKRHKSFRQVR